jgi:hypothetical protein
MCGYNDLVISFSVLLIKKLKKKNTQKKKLFQLIVFSRCDYNTKGK